MIPVIVGVADIKNASTAVENAKEPADLMTEAIQLAIRDASPSSEIERSLQSRIDSIDVVRTWTWPYADLPRLLSERLQVQPTHRECSDHGGHQPARLLDRLARRIQTGASTVGVITGAEALASLAACVKQGAVPPSGWTPPAQSVTDVFSPTTRQLGKGTWNTVFLSWSYWLSIFQIWEVSFQLAPPFTSTRFMRTASGLIVVNPSSPTTKSPLSSTRVSAELPSRTPMHGTPGKWNPSPRSEPCPATIA